MRHLTWILLISACAWDAPINPNEEAAPPLDNVLSGVVAWPGDGDPADTFITVYAADNPGPPAGLGGPVTFSAVPADTWTTDTTGLQSAPWAVGSLPDGAYLVNALMDRDGDFNPLAPSLTGATCGDWVGTHLADLSSTAPGAITAEGGVEVHDLPVILGAEVSTERPVFQLLPDADGVPPVMSRQTGKESGANLLLALQMQYDIRPTSVDTALEASDGTLLPVELGPACQPDPALDCTAASACPCDLATLAPCDTALWVWMVDADDDGAIDPYPGETQAAAGFLDVWPRVYLEYVGTPTEVDGEVVLESDLEPGERWVSENFPLGFDLVLDPDGSRFGPIDVPFPVETLSVLWSPVFRHYWEGGTDGTDANGPFDYVDLRAADVAVDDVPAGQYAVTLVSFTGQTWTLPNEIALLPSNDGSVDNATQGATLTVQ